MFSYVKCLKNQDKILFDSVLFQQGKGDFGWIILISYLLKDHYSIMFI